MVTKVALVENKPTDPVLEDNLAISEQMSKNH